MKAEARQPSAEALEIDRTVEYLRERERQLSRYSNKLRSAVQRIANIFGDDRECQICGHRKEHPDHQQHEFVPKVEISIDVYGDTFPDVNDTTSRLVITKDGLKLEDISDELRKCETWEIWQLPRESLKNIVKGNHIIRLFEIAKQKLDQTTEEYKQVSEIAEKLAGAL